MTNQGRSSHVGSALSCTDILAVLYADFLRVKPHDPDWIDRDVFIMSKGHAGAALYATLAEVGFFETTLLNTHCADGSTLSGHVAHDLLPGVELSTGSLGHGLSVAVGLSLGAPSSRCKVVCLLSDGECDEGSVWEAALFASHHRLSNLIAIIDYNKLQSLASTEDTIALEPFRAKWEAFGWIVQEVDGHDHDALLTALRSSSPKGPNLIIAHTIKGKGVSFMEGSVLWHYRSPQGDEFEAAIAELTDR